MLDGPLILWVNCSIVHTIHLRSFFTSVNTKATVDLKLNDNPAHLYQSQTTCYAECIELYKQEQSHIAIDKRVRKVKDSGFACMGLIYLGQSLFPSCHDPLGVMGQYVGQQPILNPPTKH